MHAERPPDGEHVDDQMMKLEVNLDDISGEWLGHVMELLLEAGANDVFYIPIYMKKNRPGTLLQILCPLNRLRDIEEIVFRETTTLGIRYSPLTVHRLERRFRKVETPWGAVAVKEGLLGGQVVQRAPEFEECRQLAKLHQVPLKKIYEYVWKHVE